MKKEDVVVAGSVIAITITKTTASITKIIERIEVMMLNVLSFVLPLFFEKKD